MDLYIGLGSNLGHREANIHRAINLLSSLIGPLVRASTLIETDPVDMDSDHKFLNAVAIFETRMHPTEIIRKTQMLEKSLGREVKSQNGVHFDRTIDIDILQYGDLRIDVPASPHAHESVRVGAIGRDRSRRRKRVATGIYVCATASHAVGAQSQSDRRRK